MSEQFDYAPEEVKREWKEIYNDLEQKAKPTKEDWSHFTPEFLDTTSNEVDLNETLSGMIEMARLGKEGQIGQPEARIKIETPLPITVVGVGDIHLGSIFTNIKLWEAHRQEILDTPGLYLVFLHNLVDNAIPAKFANNLLNNTVPPNVQFSVMQQEIKELDKAGKVLGAVEGDCHEGWSWAAAGTNASQLLYGYEGRSFPVLENGGILHLGVGNEEYQIGTWHKQGPFNSNFNKSHALLQNRRLGGRQTDVEMGAHHHNSEALDTWVGYKNNARKVSFLRVGTYKGYWPDGDGMNDRFVVDRWGKSGEPPGNSVTLYPYQHEVESNLGFETTTRHHEAIRIALWLELMDKKGQILELMK